jgi:hypothetical protein
MIDITQRLSRALGQAAIVLVLVGCGGGGGGGGGGVPRQNPRLLHQIRP